MVWSRVNSGLVLFFSPFPPNFFFPFLAPLFRGEYVREKFPADVFPHKKWSKKWEKEIGRKRRKKRTSPEFTRLRTIYLTTKKNRKPAFPHDVKILKLKSWYTIDRPPKKRVAIFRSSFFFLITDS